MKIKVNEAKNSNPIKYHISIVSNDKFQMYFSSFADRDFIILNVKYLWGAPTKNAREFSINFMGEIWKVKYLKLYHLCGNEVKYENAILFERVEKLFFEDPEEPRLNYMLGILEEVYHLEKA